jgi:20S proteasome alpha/beta subunit
MVAGWDEAGPGLYYVDSDGQRTRGQLFSVGSGSLYAYGVLDEGYRWDLTVDEAIELGQRSIYHATFRDAASGGTVSGAWGGGDASGCWLCAAASCRAQAARCCVLLWQLCNR